MHTRSQSHWWSWDLNSDLLPPQTQSPNHYTWFHSGIPQVIRQLVKYNQTDGNQTITVAQLVQTSAAVKAYL